MKEFDPRDLKSLYTPPPGSHKGQNGKLLIIGGSSLFHAASLWALNIASRMVDMVFYSSVRENNEILMHLKKEFRNGIIVPRSDIESYILEADCVVIGPGMMRTQSEIKNLPAGKEGQELENRDLNTINSLTDEGLQSYYLTKYLLEKYPNKKWVIDAGALQMMEPEWLVPLKGNAVITPHAGEFERIESRTKNQELRKGLKNKDLKERVKMFAEEFNVIILFKGKEDIVCSPDNCIAVKGGNAGMTKGGTGDVLAGLVGALACKNDLWLSAAAASFINKKAGDSLFEKVGYYFNSSDLADEIPRVMKSFIK